MKPVRFLNACGQTLVGNLYLADTGVIVVLAHGFASEKSSNGRFERIAHSLCEIGLSCLAFDFRGCGESDDDSLNAAKLVEDLNAALAFVRSKGFERIALHGHSLGSLICLRAYSTDVITMVLSGALTGPMKYDWDQFFAAEQLRELSKTGRLTMPSRVGPRLNVIVEAQMLDEFERIDQPKLLQSVKCPVLIIHGDGDDEERMLLQRSRAGMSYLSAGSRLDVITGAGHGFYDHLDDLIERMQSWLSGYLVG